ncbi:MAG: hypothetical protein QM820_12260 [Minicystis sp.]
MLITHRSNRSAAVERERLDLSGLLASHDVVWHGVDLGRPDWSGTAHAIALGTTAIAGDRRFHILVNGWKDALDFELPPCPGGWRRWIDTARASPGDILAIEAAVPVGAGRCRAAGRSVVVLTDKA